MKELAVAVVVLLVLVAGIVDYINRNDPPIPPARRTVRLWEKAWNQGNYTPPKCAQHWPTTCPEDK